MKYTIRNNPRNPSKPESTSNRKKENYTVNINITLNAEPLLSNLKGLFSDGEAIFISFQFTNDSRDPEKESGEKNEKKEIVYKTGTSSD